MTLLAKHVIAGHLRAEKHQLDNGLTALLLPDASAPVVSVHLWYRVGSRHESPGHTGMAHLFEHLMFNQTEHLAAGEFDRVMESAGGDTNAATWVDWTYYRDNLPAARLELALKLEADRMQHLVVTEAQVEAEREVVANERRFRVDDDVEGFLSEALFRLAFPTHPYGWPTIGWMEDILAFTVKDAQRFYRTYYAPNNAVLIVVGDFEVAEALRLIEKEFAGIAPSVIPAHVVAPEPPQRAQRRASFEKPVAADRALFAYRSPAQSDENWLYGAMLRELLCGSPSARLTQRLIVDAAIASQVQASMTPFRDPGLLEFYVGLKRGHTAAEAEAILDEELERLCKEPISSIELDKICTRIATAHWLGLEEAEGKADALGHHEVTLGDFRRCTELLTRLPKVSAEDLQHAATTIFPTEARNVVIATPSGDGAGA